MEHTTCWDLVRAAAGGDPSSRTDFAGRYASVVRSYLAARWRRGRLAPEVDEALQEVFVECLRDGGLLERAAGGIEGGFRAFLLGAARHVAQRFEERAARRLDGPATETFRPDALALDEDGLSVVFDRAWARVVVREARERMAARAIGQRDAERRVELLRLRFQEGLGPSAIATRWGQPAADVQRAYEKARAEFEAALREVVAELDPGAPEAVGRRCRELLALLRPA